MLNEMTAKRLVEQKYPGVTAKACVQYQGLFLVRVARAEPLEEDMDPFFSADPITLEVKDFSITGDILTISKLFMAAETQ